MTIHPFQTFDEVKAHIATLPANDPSITARQAAIGYGDYFVRFTKGAPLQVGFGQVAPIDSLIETLINDGWPVDEAVHEATYVIGSHRYSLFGPVHTRSHPHGQWDDVHRAHTWPCDKALYDLANHYEFDPAKFDDLAAETLRVTFTEFAEASDEGWQVANLGG